MANSSENQQAEQSSQFSPTLFDFEAFLAQEAAGGFLQPPTQDDVGLDYQDFSDLDLASNGKRLTVPPVASNSLS